jgi:hypothetical protein
VALSRPFFIPTHHSLKETGEAAGLTIPAEDKKALLDFSVAITEVKP